MISATLRMTFHTSGSESSLTKKLRDLQLSVKFLDQTSTLRPLPQRTRGGTYPNNTYLLRLQQVTITYPITYVATYAVLKQETYQMLCLLLHLAQNPKKK